MAGLAQAAAVLLAVSLYWREPANAPLAPGVPNHSGYVLDTTPSLDSEFEIAQGQTALIRSRGAAVELVDLATQEPANGMGCLLAYNDLESCTISEVEIEEGQVVLIRSEGLGVEVIDLSAQEIASVVGPWLLDHNEVERTLLVEQLRSWNVDQWMLVYNELEWLNEPALAMTE
jgi:hypothetical protein